MVEFVTGIIDYSHLIIHNNILDNHIILGAQPVGCYTEVVCLYSGTCI